MPDLLLYIGNQNYSSWSLRPWLALTAAGIAFRHEVIPFDFPAGNPAIKAVSPSGRVPLLVDGDLKIWESLAIIEYAHELYPDAGVWPKDRAARADARAISAEMVSSFHALRNACPMNIRRPVRPIALPDGVKDNVARIEALWHERLDRFGGPFLYGAFSAADAMYAPVVNRFEIYALTDHPRTLAYMEAVKAHPAFAKWREAALAESWIVPEDEA
ncbi:glutathione S-transferase [Xaviernesmea oryzae]|uniref:Glutathione S-transferase n=1 Tax=Xaviernesmea oryzae TaxID=464029 RepID=A0A1Q9AXW9_9HYPH|nr:glutathione S-transferase family protein [Xaviernesmea oryzae]OLP60287.1 glutathione S-transferase [Xaviernesmea oryzae]SEK24828.1 glutathione S-transferase [Xaviernesmea oryzae]